MISKADIKTDLKALMDAAFAETESAAEAQDAFQEGMAELIGKYIVQGINEATVTPVLTAGATPVTGTISVEAELLP